MDIKVDHNTIVVFDLDDTLYNELDFLKSAYRSIALFLEPNDWKLLYSKMFSLYRNEHNVFEFLKHNYNVEIPILLEMYRSHKPDIQMFEGVLELLMAIKHKNGRIGIITDGRLKTQMAKIESLGIYNYIDKIIISEEIGSEKPSKLNFKAIEESLVGTVYYYIADNVKKDFIAPKELGWNTVGLLDNGKNIHFDSYQHSNSYKLPDDYIIDFKELNII